MTVRRRSDAYAALRTLRDVRAVERSVETGSPAPIVHRLFRRLAGRLVFRLLRRL